MIGMLELVSQTENGAAFSRPLQQPNDPDNGGSWRWLCALNRSMQAVVPNLYRIVSHRIASYRTGAWPSRPRQMGNKDLDLPGIVKVVCEVLFEEVE